MKYDTMCAANFMSPQGHIIHHGPTARIMCRRHTSLKNSPTGDFHGMPLFCNPNMWFNGEVFGFTIHLPSYQLLFFVFSTAWRAFCEDANLPTTIYASSIRSIFFIVHHNFIGTMYALPRTMHLSALFTMISGQISFCKFVVTTIKTNALFYPLFHLPFQSISFVEFVFDRRNYITVIC